MKEHAERYAEKMRAGETQTTAKFKRKIAKLKIKEIESKLPSMKIYKVETFMCKIRIIIARSRADVEALSHTPFNRIELIGFAVKGVREEMI